MAFKAGYWVFKPDSRPVQDIPSDFFTHLYAGFAKVNPGTGEVSFPRGYEREFQTFPATVHIKNPRVKTLLSIGGPEGSAADDISAVMKVRSKREKFIDTSRALASVYHFDGLDLCWLYPSSSDDDADLDSFLNEWRVNNDLLLTAVVFHHPVIPCTAGTFHYPCRTINGKLDWINALEIDFYTPKNSPGKTGPVHARHTRSKDLKRSGSDGIGHWIKAGVESQALALCLPFHGYKWILEDLRNFGLFAPAHQADSSLPIPYRRIKTLIDAGYITEKDEEYVAAYAHNGEGSWIGYENESTITGKVELGIRKNNLGGYFAWDVGNDDDSWTLSHAAFNP